MKFFKITFSCGTIVKTGFNGDLEEAKKYFLNQEFELDESRPMSKGVKVEEILD